VRFVVVTALKDVRRRLADPAALVFWLGIPVVVGSMIALLQGDGGAPKAHLLVADLDGSFVSGLVTGAGGQEGAAQFMKIEQVELEEGRERIDAGDASALLILPEGFGDAVLKEEPAELTLITNPAQSILPRIVEEGADLLVEATFYVQRLFGEQLRVIADGPPAGQDYFADATMAAVAGQINQRFASLDGILIPPVLEVETPPVDEKGGFNFGIYFLPGILFMALLFVAQGMSSDIWDEKNGGTLRRAVAAPQSLARFMTGKLLGGAVLVAATALVGLLIAVAFYGVGIGRLPLALLWCAFAGTALLAFFYLLQVISGSQRGAAVLSTIIVFPLIMIGGSFFPFESMPPWMVAVGRWTPNGLALIRLKEILAGTAEPASLLAAVLGIGLPAILAVWLTVRRIRGGFAVG
jgi:ABC-type multidrug transport system permease subunit